MTRALLLCLTLTAAGCATVVDEHRPAPAGWPLLQVRDNVVPGYEVIRRCYKYQPTYMKLLGSIPMACAEVNFAKGTCDIWRAYDTTPEVLEHEQYHCRGHSHYGETWAEDALRNWQAYLAGRAVGSAK